MSVLIGTLSESKLNAPGEFSAKSFPVPWPRSLVDRGRSEAVDVVDPAEVLRLRGGDPVEGSIRVCIGTHAIRLDNILEAIRLSGVLILHRSSGQ